MQYKSTHCIAHRPDDIGIIAKYHELNHTMQGGPDERGPKKTVVPEIPPDSINIHVAHNPLPFGDYVEERFEAICALLVVPATYCPPFGAAAQCMSFLTHMYVLVYHYYLSRGSSSSSIPWYSHLALGSVRAIPFHAPSQTGVQAGSASIGPIGGVSTDAPAVSAVTTTADAGLRASNHGGAMPVKKPSHWYLHQGGAQTALLASCVSSCYSDIRKTRNTLDTSGQSQSLRS